MEDATRYCQHRMLHQKVNGTDVQLLVLGTIENDPGHITCVTKVDAPAYLRLLDQMEELCEALEDTVYYPLEGEICLTKLNGFGYVRSKFLRVNFDGSLLMFSVYFGVTFHAQGQNVRVIY